MTIDFSALEAPADGVALGVLVYEDTGAVGETSSLDSALLERKGFKGKAGESAVFELPERRLVALGMGKRSSAGREAFRLAAAALARGCDDLERVQLVLGEPLSELGGAVLGQAIAEGAELALYRFDRYRSGGKVPALSRFDVVGSDVAALRRGLEKGSAIAKAVCLARDLVNEPGSDMTPRRFAELATKLCEEKGLDIEVWDEERIATERLGGLMGVARGSAEPPRFVRISYRGTGVDPRPKVVLVGKGITFDSGGLSLKTSEGMSTMKTDMSGAAAVLGAMSALGGLGVGCDVVGMMPLSENMPGAKALKPGDVLRARNGKTIEVLNTDAEGRLVLSDALSLAEEEGPDAIIDLATLTGACVVALGREIAGLMGSSEGLTAEVKGASERAGEKLWPLPLPAEYREHIDSDVADMKNIGAPGQAGTIAAALLLAEFVGDVPWAHLDIAGPARSLENKGYVRKGATGFGVRTLVELVSSFEPPPSAS